MAVIASNELEHSIIPSLLDSVDDPLARVVAGFIWVRYWNFKTNWVDSVLERGWAPEYRAKFLTLLPFNEEAWERVDTHLGKTHEALYWRNVRVNPYEPDHDSTIAIERLIEYRRAGAAVICAACTVDDKNRFDESLATRALLAVLKPDSGFDELDNYQTVELIKRLQESPAADQDALFRIEWNFLPWLDRFSSGSPVTLEKRLASDPTFFAEVIGLVFRSTNDDETDNEEPSEQKQHLAQNAYKLLTEWRRCPGAQDKGSFDVEAFNEWINDARRITEESGHREIAQSQIGHVLAYAPPDPGGLWIHEAVATTLNYRDTSTMRSGFTTELFNQRGVYGFTKGREERQLASHNREKAEALDSRGYTRFATAMHEFAEKYDRKAEREESRNLFED